MKRLGMLTLMSLFSLGLWTLLASVVNPPRPRDGRGTFRILNGSDIFPESLAANLGSVYEPHGFWDGASAGPGSLGSGGQVSLRVALPSPADQATVCEEKATAQVVNTSNSVSALVDFPIGTTNSEDSNCPLWPYFAGAGGHLNPPSGWTGHTIAPSGGAFLTEVRTDGLFNISQGSCGGLPINSATFSNGTITLNFTNQNLWGTPQLGSPNPNGNGAYVQIAGSSVAALNTSPGTVVGTNLYKITNETNTSIAFAGTAAQACSVNCGTAYMPAAIGVPPYTQPMGFNGTQTAAPNPFFVNNGTPTVNYDINVSMLCMPLTGCNQQPGNSCGMNGVAF